MPCNLTNLRNYWMTGKCEWIDLFEKQLIYEYKKPVTFQISKEAKLQLFEGFINMSIFDEYPDLQEFVDNLESEEFFSNHLISDFKYFDSEDEEFKTIPKGTKVIKAFKYFHLTPEDLKELQSIASRIIQQNSVKGTLCLSVHPLDYLSMSENISNWRSCHSLDGVYRNGCLSYMTDFATIICYLRSDELVNLPNFPKHIVWNNKKWRMTLHFDAYNRICFTGRQYPFESNSVFIYIQEMLNELFFYKKEMYWSSFSHDTIQTTNSGKTLWMELIPLHTTAKPLSEIVSQDKWSYAYPDLLYSSKYQYKWSTKHPAVVFEGLETVKDYYENGEYAIGTIKDDIQVILGYEVRCACCGTNRVMDSDVMLCEDCYQRYKPIEYKKHKKLE